MALTIGFFGGLAVCVVAIAMVYLPAGLFLAGAISVAVSTKLFWSAG